MFGGTALAADKPIRGTAACANAVSVNSDVVAARQQVRDQQVVLNGLLRDGTDDAAIATARAELARREARLSNVTDNVTDSVCRDGDTTTPPVTTEPAPVSNGDRTFAEARRLIAALECDDDFVSDQARIASLRTAAGNGLSQAQQNRLTDLLNNRLDALRDCEPADPQPTTVTVPPATSSTQPSVVGGAQVDNNVTVNPTQDDGSVADTDGSQIEITPEGSASTGAA